MTDLVIREDFLEMLKWLHSKNFGAMDNAMVEAVEIGNIKTMVWIWDTFLKYRCTLSTDGLLGDTLSIDSLEDDIHRINAIENQK